MAGTGSDSGLATIEKGVVPECRMRDAVAVQDFVRKLVEADNKASYKRARVDGLVDGNPPYSAAKLKSVNRAEAANVNWGTGRSYLESGSGAFYDLFSEAPGFVSIATSHGQDEDKMAEYSRAMSLEADVLFANDLLIVAPDTCVNDPDSEVQLSQNEMVLHGTGPMFFENEHVVFPAAVESGSVVVPARTRSNVDRWEAAAVLFDYYPPEVFKFVRGEKAAAQVGWDVEFAKLVIENAMDVRQPDNSLYNWEFYQNELKQNSLAYYNESQVCKLAHVFWKEFDGRITHAIVEREDSTGSGSKYLFIKVGRYASFRECIHPMYYDRGRGGYHHSVTGLGVKMYSGMEFENRLMCNLMDAAFAPKTLFMPTTQEAAEKFKLTHLGPFAMLPPGTEVKQAPIQGLLTDGLAMLRTSGDTIRSNLSQYRQPVQPDRPGNPQTAFKERMDASQQSALSNTTFARYYKQLDTLYSEIVRRLCNLNSTDQRATGWQKRCMSRGVPRECFGRIRSVKAVRVLGQGSPFMRAQMTSELGQVIGGCPEDGQNNWRNDFIASRAGQSAVNRYNPPQAKSKLASDQRERAANQVVGMKTGMPPVITTSQNPVVFAGMFLQACVQAIQSIQKGADPRTVVAFLELAGPGANAHIQRMAKDPIKKELVAEFEQTFKRIAKMADELKKRISAQAKQAQAQRQKTQAAMSDSAIKRQKVMGDLQLKAVKLRHQLAERAVRTRQDLSLQDARVASDISRNNRLAAFSGE